MQPPSTIPSRDRAVPASAIVGVLASAALLAAWLGVSRIGSLAGAPEKLLFDFVAAFITIFGGMVVSVALVGWLPIRGRRARRG